MKITSYAENRSQPKLAADELLQLEHRLDTALPGRASSARIFDRLLTACRARPNATAIVHGDNAWTYAQIDRASRTLAERLIALPAVRSRDEVVAVYARRSAELVVAMLACMRAGFTFAVLDAAYPFERLAQQLAVLQPARLIAAGLTPEDDQVLDQLKLRLPAARIHLPEGTLCKLLTGVATRSDRLDCMASTAIAYLLFTSGTTGIPKCIETSHAPLVHFVDWYEKKFAVDEGCRFSMLSGLGHDPILRDIFIPLSTGVELHIPPQAALLDPVKLYAWMARCHITHAHMTPQLLRLLCAGRRDSGPLRDLRFVFSGGDNLRTKQANEVLGTAPAARVVNFYGCTETPQAMAFHVFDPNEDSAYGVVPIGRGIADAQVLLIHDALAGSDNGKRGQIAIRTRFLSAGYRGDPLLTSRKFLANRLTEDQSDRLYLTGDIGHYRPDGALVVEGRSDDQVKIRGFRVELSDVVHHLERIPGVTDAIALAEPTPDGERRLVAYCVGTATTNVKDAMTAAVPAYMVPSRIVWLDRFPLLPNGKLDRPALEKLGAAAAAAIEAHEHLEPLEAKIVAEWKALLGQPAIHPDASFVELGGDSLSFIQASMHLEALLGHCPDGWEKLSIRELARAKIETPSRWTRIDSSVLIRAISIVSVVVGHFELPDLPGSVRALFVVSGMSFGKYIVPAVLRTQTVSPISRLALKIAIPAILYTLFVNTVYGLPKWPGLLLVNNFISPNSHVSGVGFWFIDVLVQCFFLLALLLAIPRVRQLVASDPFAFVFGLTLALDAVALVSPSLWNTAHLADRVPQQYLCELCLGWALIYADSPRRKLLVVAALVATFALPAWHLRDPLVFPVLVTLFLVLQARVSLPLYVGRLVNVIAGASLFIYLMDHQVGSVLEKIGLPNPIVGIFVAVAVGIAVRSVWHRAGPRVRAAVSAR